MKKMLLKTAAVSSIMTAAFAFSAFAETPITSVSFYAEINEDDAAAEGVNSPDFYTDNSDMYDLTWEETSSSTSAKSEKSYRLTFIANGDYVFPENENQITVTGTGVTEIGTKSTKDDGTTLEVRVKAWPYSKLTAPTIETTEIGDLDTSRIEFNKNGAGTVEYVITYEDYDGDTGTKHGTTTSSYVSVSSYNKAYGGNKEENDKQDRCVTGFAIRATKLSSSSNPNIVPSDWVWVGDEPDYDMTNYETWGDWLGHSGSSSSNQTINNVATAGPGSGSTSSAGWAGSGNDWYWRNANGTNQTGWVQDGGNWYYCDPNNGGKMAAGWIFDGANWYYLNEAHDGTYGRMMSGWLNHGGHWYYLNESHDGTFGRMMTSWQVINGVQYYFRPNSGGPLGSMVSNATVRINNVNYTFNADGALVG